MAGDWDFSGIVIPSAALDFTALRELAYMRRGKTMS